MSKPVVNGAILQCSFGVAPGTAPLSVPPANGVTIGGQPAANILDNKTGANIAPFGLCASLANPITAAQTAAALGVLTPGTCTPIVPAPWTPTAPTKMIGPAPALTDAAVCVCAYGGVIKVNFGGAPTAEIA